jgi:flagellar motor switch protein FliG
MTNEEKAAILLLLLDEEIAAQVMKNLKKGEVHRIGKHMSRITSISTKEAQAVAKEFCDLVKEKGGLFSVGVNQARNIVMKALGPENAGGMLNYMKADDDPLDEIPAFEKLRDMDPKLLVDFTRTEHPQTVALILAQLRPDRAADVLDHLAPETQIEVVRRMASLKSVPKDVIEEVAKTLETEVMTGSTGDKEIGGVRRMAEILKNMKRDSENNIINAIDGTDPDLASEIRSMMFTFDDLLQIDDRGMQDLLKELSSEDLARALKVIDEEARAKVYRNMSKRGADMIREEIEMMPPTRISDVEKSQKIILEIAKRLESEGRILIMRRDEDQFV